MKKILLFISFIMAFNLVACSNSTNKTPHSQDEISALENEDEENSTNYKKEDDEVSFLVDEDEENSEDCIDENTLTDSDKEADMSSGITISDYERNVLKDMYPEESFNIFQDGDKLFFRDDFTINKTHKIHYTFSGIADANEMIETIDIQVDYEDINTYLYYITYDEMLRFLQNPSIFPPAEVAAIAFLNTGEAVVYFLRERTASNEKNTESFSIFDIRKEEISQNGWTYKITANDDSAILSIAYDGI